MFVNGLGSPDVSVLVLVQLFEVLPDELQLLLRPLEVLPHRLELGRVQHAVAV